MTSKRVLVGPHFKRPLIFKALRHALLPMIKPLALLLSLFVFGSLGYYFLGVFYDKDWNMVDCAYMTSITLTTVGYSDFLGAQNFDAGQIYTMFLAIAGLGGTLYSISLITAFVVEGRFRKLIREVRMQSTIKALRNHTIICGAGESGLHVAREIKAKKKPFVMIERNEEAIEKAQEEFPNLLFVLGDATNEHNLAMAGIEHAQHIVAVLDTDRDNLFLIVSARFLRGDINIVSKCEHPQSTGKFMQAGANHVVNPALIGGLRMASLVLEQEFGSLLHRI